MTIEMIPFSLRTAVFSVLKTLCVKASEQTLDLVWHLDPDVPDQVIGDPLRLRQVGMIPGCEFRSDCLPGHHQLGRQRDQIHAQGQCRVQLQARWVRSR